MARKKQLRKDYLAKRAALSDAEYDRINQVLLKHFKTLNFDGVNYILIFLPLFKHREPDTTLLITWLQQQHPQIKLAYPRTDVSTWNMSCYLQDEHLVLEANQWGILEPVSGTVIEPAKLDMVIVPLLTFDQKGYRVGYGKGFYDRFLKQCKPSTAFIGLSQFDMVDEIEDADEFDIPLHFCIIEDGIVEFV